MRKNTKVYPDVQYSCRLSFCCLILKKIKKALVLIQGTGAVRAGIWARSVCINENLEKGSMLPFIDLCRKIDIPVLVMNPNYNRDP